MISETDFGNPRLLMLLGWWLSLRGRDGALPPRAALDPLQIARTVPGILPHLWMVGTEGERPRFRYRLIGGALHRAGVLARPGDYVDQFPGADGPDGLQHEFETICRSREARRRRGAPRLPHDPFVRQSERLSLPFAGPDGAVNVILSATMYVWASGFETAALF